MDDILHQVMVFADAAHGTQMRKYESGRYIVHPVRVMEKCRQYTNKLPMLAAALLHDVLEDTATGEDAMLAFLRQVMPHDQAHETWQLVKELTDVFVPENYPELSRAACKQKEAERMALVSADAQTIKYADVADNAVVITRYKPAAAQPFLLHGQHLLTVMDKGNAALRAEAMQTLEVFSSL